MKLKSTMSWLRVLDVRCKEESLTDRDPPSACPDQHQGTSLPPDVLLLYYNDTRWMNCLGFPHFLACFRSGHVLHVFHLTESLNQDPRWRLNPVLHWWRMMTPVAQVSVIKTVINYQGLQKVMIINLRTEVFGPGWFFLAVFWSMGSSLVSSTPSVFSLFSWRRIWMKQAWRTQQPNVVIRIKILVTDIWLLKFQL